MNMTSKMEEIIGRMLEYEKKLNEMDKQRVDAIEEKDFWMNKSIRLEDDI